MTYDKRSSGPSRARPFWPTWWCLLMLSGCSTTPAPISVSQPPPANLAADPWAGPAYPPGDVSLERLLGIVAARELQAAQCRAQVRGLLQAWPSSADSLKR